MNLELRDHFATKAMELFLTQTLPEGHTWNFENIAKSSYDLADKMMEARGQCYQTVN